MSEAAFLAGLDHAADRRQFEEDDVAQGFLGVVGDADGDAAVGFEPGPFVGGGVFQVVWRVHVHFLRSGACRYGQKRV